MNGRLLLDSNAVIAIFANDQSALQLIRRFDESFLPIIALGELYYGVQRSSRVDENLKRIDAFRSTIVILPCDETTAEQYGRIKNELRVAGTPIPENDIWIASIASQYQLGKGKGVRSLYSEIGGWYSSELCHDHHAPTKRADFTMP